jgi:hypothetical protein
MDDTYTSRGDTLREMFEFEIACQGLSGLTGEYADAVFDAGARDVNALSALTPEWVRGAMPREPSPRFKSVAEAGRKAARAFCVKFGGANLSGASRVSTSPAGVIAARSGATATPRKGGSDRSTGGASAAQLGGKVPSRDNITARSQGVPRLISELRERATSSAVIGFEAQWHAAAGDALSRLELELKVDILQYYDQQCATGRELLLRELHRKAAGILAHRKRKQTKK